MTKHLTRRDRDMIQGAMDGKRNKIIAADHDISENTVKVYMSRLFVKLGVDRRAGLANWGRAYAESERLIAERYREMHPDLELKEQTPSFRVKELAKFDVFRTMAASIQMTREQAYEIAVILSTKEHG
jgi:DNA-binding CsgD family transcriptional regulator